MTNRSSCRPASTADHGPFHRASPAPSPDLSRPGRRNGGSRPSCRPPAPLVAGLGLLLLATTSTVRAHDVSVLDFPEGVFAFAATEQRLHRIPIPGGRVLASEANGKLARVDVEEGVNIVAAVPYGLAGRQVHLDMGKVRQVQLGSAISLVTAETGTALYHPGVDRLVGFRISDGYPQGAMVFGSISATHWRDMVAVHGSIQGRVYQVLLPLEGLKDLHVGTDSVISLWEGRGTLIHVLTAQGFFTQHISEGMPGNLSARTGITQWLPIAEGVEKPGTLFPQGELLSAAGPALF